MFTPDMFGGVPAPTTTTTTTTIRGRVVGGIRNTSTSLQLAERLVGFIIITSFAGWMIGEMWGPTIMDHRRARYGLAGLLIGLAVSALVSLIICLALVITPDDSATP